MLLAKAKKLRGIDLFKRQSKRYAARQAWVYVLACQGGFYYVGFSRFLHNRLKCHFGAMGAFFTRLHPPQRVVSWESARDEKDEFKKWTEVARKYGHSRVGGYSRSMCLKTGFKWPFPTPQTLREQRP